MRADFSFTIALFALACAPSAPAPSAGPSLGGASFVLWPPPESDPSEANNPWLTGDALAPALSVTGGAPGSGGSTLPEASGGTAVVGPIQAGSGGTVEPPPAVPVPAVLRLRAYVESTGSFKGLLVEHVGGDPSPVCTVDLYSNGSTEAWRSLDVPAGLAPGDRALLCLPDGAFGACTVGFGGSAYNGNDALVLHCGGEVLDVFGTVGADPGKGWTGVGADGVPASTLDAGLWRCGDLSSAPLGFDLTQWVSWDWEGDPSWAGPTCPSEAEGGAGATGL